MIRRRITVPASTDKVWQAITHPEQIPGWFGGEMEWVLEPGAPLRYRGEDGEERQGTVEEVREGRHLRFVWWPVDADGQGDRSEVTYLVEPAAGGASLTVQETPVRVAGPRASATASAVPCDKDGWDHWDSRLAGAWVGLSADARTGVRL